MRLRTISFPFLAFFIVGLIIIDTSIVEIFVPDINERSSSITLFIFILIVSLYTIGQFFILRTVKHKIKEAMFPKQNQLIIIHNAISIITYVMIAITAVIFIEMAMMSRYNIHLLQAVIMISHLISIFLLGFLSWRFLLWFRSNRNLVVFIYALATIMLATNLVFTLFYASTVMGNKPAIITPLRDSIADFSSVDDLFISGLNLTNTLSFFTTWTATVLILHHYSKKLGMMKYWLIVSIPVIYFLSQFQSLFLNIFDKFRVEQPFLFGVIFTLIFNSTNASGGILFGIAFWSISKSVNRSAVKDYMVISAVGIMLLFSSIHSALAVDNAPYPPFGLGAVWFTVISSYLLLVGVYSSALSLPEIQNCAELFENQWKDNQLCCIQ